MFGDSWERFAPLTGAVFFVLVLIGFLLGGDTPDSDEAAIKVDVFYKNHHDKQTIAALIIAIGAAFLPFFASTLRRRLDWSGGTGRLANVAFGGGILATVGFWILSTVHLALADAGGDTSPQVTQALNALDNNDFIPVAGGMGVLLLASGLASVRYRALPRVLAWAAFVIGILAFTPVGFFAFIAGGVWIGVTSVVLFLSGDPAATSEPAPLPA